MTMYKVLNIGAVKMITTKNGQAGIVYVDLKELSLNKDYKTSYFVPDDGIPFSVGDDILAEVEVNGKYVNLKKAQKPTPPPILPEPAQEPLNGKDKVPAEVWEAKDLRMVRMNALTHATAICLQVHKDEKLTETEMAEMIKMTARNLVDWVYSK